MSRKKLEVEQIKATSVTPPADRGFYKKGRNAHGHVGDLIRRDPASGRESTFAHVTELTAAQLATYTGRTGEVVEVTDVAGRPQYRWNGSTFVSVVTAETDAVTGATGISIDVSDEASLVVAAARGANIRCFFGSTITLNDTLVLKSGTHLDLNGSTLRLANGINKSPVKNQAFDATPAGVSITSSGRTATVTWAGHGKSVGQYVAILGADQASYNGVWRVESVPSADSLTYLMFEPASASPATGAVTGRAADSNISIINGTVDMNEANQTVSGNSDTHAVRIFNCYGGKIDLKVLNAKKYAVLLANVDQFDVPELEVDTASDGLHMMGPIGTVNVGTVSGKSGDDLVAFTMGDFATYEVCRGNIRNVTIDAIKPRYSLTGLKIAGNPNCTAEFIRVGSISGVTRRQSIYVTNDTNLTQTNIEHLEVGPVRVLTGVAAANTYQGMTIRGGASGGTMKLIKIGRVSVLDNDTTDAISISDATFGRIEIEGFHSRSTGVRKFVNIGGAATVQKWVKVAGVDVTPADSTSAIVCAVGGTANVAKLVLNGASAPVAGTSARLVQVSGTTATLTECDFDGFSLTGGNSFYDQAVAGQPAPTIKMYGGTKGAGYATGLNLRDSATVYLSEMDWGTFTNRPIQTGTTGTVEVFGSAKKLGARMINKGAGATVYATGHTFVCDTATHQTARNGDMVTDSASGLVVHYNGAAWVAVS